MDSGVLTSCCCLERNLSSNIADIQSLWMCEPVFSRCFTSVNTENCTSCCFVVKFQRLNKRFVNRSCWTVVRGSVWQLLSSSWCRNSEHVSLRRQSRDFFRTLIKSFSPPSSSAAEMFRRRTGCRCWRSTGSTRGSRPNSASWKFSSANRIPPNPSRPPQIPTVTAHISSHHCCEDSPGTPSHPGRVQQTLLQTWTVTCITPRRSVTPDQHQFSCFAAFMSRRKN